MSIKSLILAKETDTKIKYLESYGTNQWWDLEDIKSVTKKFVITYKKFFPEGNIEALSHFVRGGMVDCNQVKWDIDNCKEKSSTQCKMVNLAAKTPHFSRFSGSKPQIPFGCLKGAPWGLKVASAANMVKHACKANAGNYEGHISIQVAILDSADKNPDNPEEALKVLNRYILANDCGEEYYLLNSVQFLGENHTE